MKRVITLFLFALTLVFLTYPSAFDSPENSLPDNNDTRLITYIIGQVQQNITNHQPLYYGTFFAPQPNTLAYSDLFLTSSLITLPVHFFTNSPVAIFNLAFIIDFTLTIVCSFFLFQYLFKDRWLALLSTLLFNFSGFHLSYYPHLQIFSFWLFFLALYFFLRFMNENKQIFLPLFFLTATFQLVEGIFPFYLLFFTCAIIFFSGPALRLIHRQKSSPYFLRQLKLLFFSTLIVLPFWLALIFPYIKLHFTYPEATRPIRDAANFSLGLEQIFTFYHSWTVIILLLAALLAKAVFMIRKPTRLQKARFHLLEFSMIFIFSIVMSLGPVLKMFGKNIRIFGLPIPLPYAVFYYLFPGFQGFRTPSRFIILALFSSVIIISFALRPIFKAVKPKTKHLFTFLVLSFLFLEAGIPLKSYPVNINLDPVYNQVKALPQNDIILELPIKLWNSPDHEIESIRSIYTLFHHHRRLGGFSGFATNDWVDLVQKIDTYGLNWENLNTLRSLGVTHYIQGGHLHSIPQ